MADQFSGWTDDDLFNDDFEPIESEPVVISDNHTSSPLISTTAEPEHDSAPTPSALLAEGLGSSIHARTADGLDSSIFSKPSRKASPQAAVKPSQPPASPEPEAATTLASASAEDPRDRPHPRPSDNNAHKSQGNAASPTNLMARMQSGANPRQKPTEAELADKMQRMKLFAAEQTRKFQVAAADERSHAAAIERGAHEVARRNAVASEQRRHLEDERAKNRQRKLRAMGATEGGWDQGKDEFSDTDAAVSFRGLNGGIRGAKGGISSSQFAHMESAYQLDRGRPGRGRGRGNANRGRDLPTHSWPQHKQSAMSPPPPLEEFPALVPVKPSNKSTKSPATMPSDLPLQTLPGSSWDDEMQALDAMKSSWGDEMEAPEAISW